MVQIAAPSRTRIPSYADLRSAWRDCGAHQCRFIRPRDWRPVILIERQCNHEEVSRWYRAADICLVTSLHDGMNLVAKEFVAARDDEDGVLVLSKFTGAAVELRDALLVNPYDVVGVAESHSRGLGDEPARTPRTDAADAAPGDGIQHLYVGGPDHLGDLRELRLEPEQRAEVNRVAPTSIRRAKVPQKNWHERAWKSDVVENGRGRFQLGTRRTRGRITSIQKNCRSENQLDSAATAKLDDFFRAFARNARPLLAAGL